MNDLVHTLPLLERRLESCGWKVHTWVVEPGWQALRKAGYNMDRVTQVDAASPAKRGIWEFSRFPRIVRGKRPSVVFQFSNFIFRDLSAPQVTVLRSPTFFSDEYAKTRRRGLYQTLRYRLGRRYSRKTVERAAAVFCISNTHRRDIIQSLGSIGEKVKTSYLGFNRPTGAINLREQSRTSVIQSLSEEARRKLLPLAETKRKVIVNVAHYYEHKNLGDLLEAVHSLQKRGSDVSLILTAGLPEYQGPWDERTRHDVKLARQLADDGVLFDLGPVPHEVVWKLLALADVFAFPSSLESFGHPLLEAMSMRTPVVAADTRIHREIAGDGAYYHRVGDPADLASKLADILDGRVDVDVLLSDEMSQASQFTWENHVETLVKAIQELSGESSQTSHEASRVC